jgi:hypothetical protein
MKKWRQKLGCAASFGHTEVKNRCCKSRISAAANRATSLLEISLYYFYATFSVAIVTCNRWCKLCSFCMSWGRCSISPTTFSRTRWSSTPSGSLTSWPVSCQSKTRLCRSRYFQHSFTNMCIHGLCLTNMCVVFVLQTYVYSLFDKHVYSLCLTNMCIVFV